MLGPGVPVVLLLFPLGHGPPPQGVCWPVCVHGAPDFVLV